VVDARPRQVDTFDLHGHTFSKGDQIVVKPSAPRHRDGFVARVLGARLDAEGNVEHVDVFGAPGSKAPLLRSLRPERLAPMSRPKRRKNEEG
jgi:hypothetical protein